MSGRDLETEYRERVGRAVACIERNLSSPLSLEVAAAEAAWSFFHFHRVFTAIMGMGPGEYLRMRRLTEAARLLSTGSLPAASIAAVTGFGSAEAFSRSFKSHYGVTPGRYRDTTGVAAIMNPFGPGVRPLAHRAGCLEGEPRLERYGPVRLLARSTVLALEDPGIGSKVNLFWDSCAPAFDRALDAGVAAGRGRRWGIAEPAPGSPGSAIAYFAAIERAPGARVPGGLREYTIPGGEYLLAIHRGPSRRLNETYLYLYGTWLPRAGLEPGKPMDFDFYGERYDFRDPESDGSLVEFRIPVSSGARAPQK